MGNTKAKKKVNFNAKLKKKQTRQTPSRDREHYTFFLKNLQVHRQRPETAEITRSVFGSPM